MSDSTRRGIRKRAFLMAEQLTLDERFRKGCAVECDKGTFAPAPVLVERVSDEFLPRAALAGDQDGCAAVGDLFDLGVDLLHCGTLADQVMKRIASNDLRAELFDLLLEFLVIERTFDDDAQ